MMPAQAMSAKPANDTVADPLRLDAVRGTGLLDTDPEPEFDRLTRLAARLTGAPVTFISLVDRDRDFYKACFGFPEPLASERQISGTTFCHYALASDGPLVIEDTLADPLYRDVPTVQSLGVRAYLGVPLVLAGGAAIGSFCAIDFAPRRWTPLDIEVMQELAASTLREIELRGALAAAADAQQNLAAERRFLDATIRQMPAGLLVADTEGNITLSNAQAAEILGGIPSNVLDPTREVGAFHPDGRRYTPAESPLSRSIVRGEVVVDEEITYVRPDGSRRVISVSSTPIRDGDGSTFAAALTIRDVTERHRLQMENIRLYEEARQANRAKDDFFAAVSHELRTPMTAVMGWARILRTEQLDNPTAIEAAEAIESSAALQAQLVDDLLDFSRISQGKIELTTAPLDLGAVIDEAVRDAQPAAAGKGIRLRTTVVDAGPVTADAARLRQIINNLLSNAVKFTPTGGLIEVSLEVRGDRACISVRDTGRGMSPDLLPHIFDRGRQATSAELGGLGLGLTIVRHLVEMHGGTVRAESEGEGKGAMFMVCLPR
jgi:PAS domain S-box-containing protein